MSDLLNLIASQLENILEQDENEVSSMLLGKPKTAEGEASRRLLLSLEKEEILAVLESVFVGGEDIVDGITGLTEWTNELITDFVEDPDRESNELYLRVNLDTHEIIGDYTAGKDVFYGERQLLPLPDMDPGFTYRLTITPEKEEDAVSLKVSDLEVIPVKEEEEEEDPEIDPFEKVLN